MRAPRPCPGIVCLLALAALAAAGCGGGSGSTSGTNPQAESGKSVPAPPKSDFPAPEGRSLAGLIKDEAMTKSELKVTTEALAFYPGENRYPFTLAEKKPGTGEPGKEIADAEAALYFAEAHPLSPEARSELKPQARSKGNALEQAAVGPFPVRIESLATQTPFQGKTTTEASNVASIVYSTELNLPGDGEYRPELLIKEKGGFEAKSLPSIHVGEFAKIPRPGEPAPLIHTPTAKSVGGDLAALTTRIPPDTLNKVDYAEVLGKEPIILLFATPKFCQSRVCGPVVDVAQQAQKKFEGKADFIHMEIYNENEPSQHVRPQVRKFHLPSEPWLFAIDREGVVKATLEGGFGTELMDKTVEKVVGG